MTFSYGDWTSLLFSDCAWSTNVRSSDLVTTGKGGGGFDEGSKDTGSTRAEERRVGKELLRLV